MPPPVNYSRKTHRLFRLMRGGKLPFPADRLGFSEGKMLIECSKNEFEKYLEIRGDCAGMRIRVRRKLSMLQNPFGSTNPGMTERW